MEENAWIEDRVKDVLAGDEYIDQAKFQKIFGFKNVGLIGHYCNCYYKYDHSITYRMLYMVSLNTYLCVFCQ
jgi:hypothetical protein